MHLAYVLIHVTYRVHHAEYGIHMLVVAPQESVNIYSTCRKLMQEWPWEPYRGGSLG